MDYTNEQRVAIQDAVLAGRREMERTTAIAGRFFREFCKSGGLQVPGYPATNRDHVMAASSYIVHALENDLVRRAHTWPWLETFIIEETNRALSEANWVAAQQDVDIVGMRLEFVEDSVYFEESRSAVPPVDYGLGFDVYPIDAIVVLPPGCSTSTFWTVVYRDEIKPKKQVKKRAIRIKPALVTPILIEPVTPIETTTKISKWKFAWKWFWKISLWIIMILAGLLAILAIIGSSSNTKSRK